MGIRVFNVAEKHSVARDVSAILSRNQGGLRSRDGRSVYNKIFEFNYQIQGQQCHMIFTSIHGHLMELEFEDRYRKWHSCDPLDLYTAPVKKHVPQDKLNIKQTLEEEARKCQWLILWLDCDREGENIAFEVVQVCTDANRQLNVWRARFSSIIEREIHQSIQRLGRPNQLFSDAVDVRQEIDLRIGASFTRFQTMLLRDAFVLDFAADGRNVVLSYGPCQFPTLGFVVERYWEIQSHEPEEFWTINCTHNADDCTASFNWMRGHLFDYTCAVIIYEMCIQEPTATVTQVRQRETLKRPPHPLSTIELEKRASRYFRMGAKQTMKVAEELYLSGFISYPRTETDSFSPETDLHTIVQDQQQHPVWGSYAQRLLDPGAGLWRNPSNGGHDDKAHPPIHPTKFSAGESSWTPDHHKLYELVVRHFLACVSQPAVGAETTVDIDIAGELFCTTGRVILAKNYLEVYRFESWGGSIIPTYTLGHQFIPTTLTLDSGVTRPPPLLSEADLMECMDKAGIGTDATMHDHIQKLLDRYYATKDMNTTRFTPTHLGEALVMGYDDMGYELWKPYLRAMMESDMKAVSIGTKNKAEVLATCLQQMKACFQDWFDREKIIGDEEHPPAWIAKLNKAKLFEAMDVFFERANRPVGNEQHTFGEVVRRCDRCQDSDMVLKRKPDGNFMVGCLGYPQCKNVVWLPGPISEASVTTTVCSTCTPGPVFKIQFKFRRLEIPMHFSTEHLGCVGGCDDILKQLIETCGTGSRDILGVSGRGRGSNTPSSNFQQSAGRGRGSNTSSSNFQQSAGRGRGSNTSSSNVQQSAGRGRGSNPSSSNVQQSIPRQRTCTQCRQTGHTSNNCPSQASRSSSARSQGTNQQGEPSIPCGTCGSPCTLRTANTESNRGKKFYSCQGCNFFIWEDVYNERNAPSSNYSNQASAQGRRGGRGRGGRSGRGVSNTNGGNFVSARSVSNTNGGNFVSATGEPITDRRCFICQDPSHFANVCPSRGM